MRQTNIKVFFIVEGANIEGIYANEEIFHDYCDAKEYAETIRDSGETVIAHIGTVANSFKEPEGGWNYDDHSDTFNKLYKIDLFKAYQAH